MIVSPGRYVVTFVPRVEPEAPHGPVFCSSVRGFGDEGSFCHGLYPFSYKLVSITSLSGTRVLKTERVLTLGRIAAHDAATDPAAG